MTKSDVGDMRNDNPPKGRGTTNQFAKPYRNWVGSYDSWGLVGRGRQTTFEKTALYHLSSLLYKTSLKEWFQIATIIYYAHDSQVVRQS